MVTSIMVSVPIRFKDHERDDMVRVQIDLEDSKGSGTFNSVMYKIISPPNVTLSIEIMCQSLWESWLYLNMSWT